jgi:hypothetical protein
MLLSVMGSVTFGARTAVDLCFCRGSVWQFESKERFGESVCYVTECSIYSLVY